MFYIFIIAVVIGASLSFELYALWSIDVMIALNVLVIGFAIMAWFFHQRNGLNVSQQALERRLNNFLKVLLNYTPIQNVKKFNLIKFRLIFLNLMLGFIVGLNLVQLKASTQPLISADLKTTSNGVLKVDKQWHSVTIEDFSKTQTLKHYVKLSVKASLNFPNKEVWKPATRIRVNWYLTHAEFKQLQRVPRLGESWFFYGKLKPVRGSLSEGTRDYEAWLFQKGIAATITVSGVYVKKQNHQTYKVENEASIYTLSGVRESFSRTLNYALNHSTYAPIYRALILGDKSAITSSEWTLFRQTGTIHLMAISGLHMTIMAAMGFMFAKGCWWLFAYRQNLVDLPMFSAIFAAIFASIYLLLSGGDIPTQRAWIMVMTFIVFLSLQRMFQPFSALSMAVFCVLVWDVSAILSNGFWLSFLAVSLIFWVLPLCKERPKWLIFIIIQLVLSIGLMPLLILYYGEVPLYSVAANFVAVPFITFLALPLLLIISIMAFISTDLTMMIVSLLDECWHLLWMFLKEIQAWPYSAIKLNGFGFIGLLISYLGLWFIYIVSYQNRRIDRFNLAKTEDVFPIGRYLTLSLLFLILVVMMMSTIDKQRMPSTLKQGVLQMDVLDVGQGLSIVMKTQNHTLIYDTGPKWGTDTNAAKLVLVPFLHHHKINQIDHLIISHSDNDHAGGANVLVESYPITTLLSGQPVQLNTQLRHYLNNQKEGAFGNNTFKYCQSPMSWEYDGVQFEVISTVEDDSVPAVTPNKKPIPKKIKRSDNDWSCVLKVSIGESQILIPGDLGKRYEQALLKNLNMLPAERSYSNTLLIAGHHGSKHSSSQFFLNALKPNHLVFSTGYLNRFGFPHKEVVERLFKVNPHARWWNTACSGSLGFEIDSKQIKLMNESRKSQGKWYHHRCQSSQQGALFQ